ncbi:MAG TPA: nucleoside-diphosphate sugar epimerase/dehydratase [Verrucomicrobiota bacterium]|nr:nucleoside-diphosphate sugar epimerase/dehydratase [Verrucomicrobiota bacterium]
MDPTKLPSNPPSAPPPPAVGANPGPAVPKQHNGFSLAERRIILAILYSAGLMAAYWLAFQFRFDFKVPENFQESFRHAWWMTLPLKLLALVIFGQFTGLLSFFGLPDLWRIFYAMTAVSVLLFVAHVSGISPWPLPRGVVLTDYVLSFAAIVGIRTGFRVIRERLRGRSGPRTLTAKRVGIIGAGDVGASLAKDLLARRGLGLVPVVFFDDDSHKWNSQVHGIPVRGQPERLRNPDFRADLDEVIIALPTASAERIREIVRLLQSVHLKFETVPSYEQLATGKVRVSQLRPVEIQDLLNREPVKLDSVSIQQQIERRTVMVTGAGGSIGSELCRQIVERDPRALLMLDQSEVQLFPIEQELLGQGYGGQAVPIVADILDEARMRFVFTRFKPDLVFHAAAHKHVPMMESQPGEALKNNSIGTARLSNLAREYGVDRFVLISTDKAINPTSVMGASKRLAEIYLQALSASASNGTKFMAVRFGNVLGSSGSVIPVFTRQIAAGGPVTVTHPEVKRYFMTIPEAVGLVLQSAFMGDGGEIFVLDMGQPVKIVDLARQLIELNGLEPDEDIEIRFTGLRPGEKLFEELSHRTENHQTTSHPKVMRFVSEPRALDELQAEFAALERQLDNTERNQLKQRIKQLVPEYKPYLV